MELTEKTIDRIAELGAVRNPVKAHEDGEPFITVPIGMKVESLAALCPPTRVKQHVKLVEVASFCEYVKKFATADTLIFADSSSEAVRVIAVLDYHGLDVPDYCSHLATFQATQTPDWLAWSAADRKPMQQVDFATWVEDNSKLFVEPNGASLLELVRTLHGHKNARFNLAVRLDNGAMSVGYDEDIVVKGASVTKGDSLELPPILKAGIAVFQGMPKYAVEARLKVRVNDRKLSLFFETVARHEIVSESVKLIVDQITKDIGIKPLMGSPA